MANPIPHFKLQPLACLGLVVAACNSDRSSNELSRAAPPATAPPAAVASAAVPETARYGFSAADSQIRWVAQQGNRTHKAAFSKFDGTIVVVGGDLSRAAISASIDLGPPRSDDPKHHAELDSAAIRKGAEPAVARFVSTAVTQGGEMGATNTVTGNLELHGITRPIRIPATIHLRPESFDLDAEFSMNRKDFGVLYPGKRDDLIQDAVVVTLLIHAKRAQ